MKRTTIMISDDLRSRAARYAQRLGISFGELVRNSLEAALSEKAGRGADKIDSFFQDSEVFQGDAPDDLARNHDKYLYGVES